VPHTVLRVASVGRVVAAMSRRERRSYDAAVQALAGEGCAAGGKRLAAIDEGDYPMCQRQLYGAWRMTTVYRPAPQESIVIVAVAQHTEHENPNATLAEIFPGLSAVGRRRSDQPPCCDDAQKPPALSGEAETLLLELFGL
jgi:hypothetical protein